MSIIFLVTLLCFTATGVMSADVAYLTTPSRSSLAAVLYILPPALKVSGSLRYLAYAAAKLLSRRVPTGPSAEEQ